MLTVLLLIASNVFMTFAWYGHLKARDLSLWQAILISWGIAFFEYCLMVPANRWGYARNFTGAQLKILQEAITLVVFAVFAVLYLNERMHWKHGVAFALVLAAVAVMNYDTNNGSATDSGRLYGKPDELRAPDGKPAPLRPVDTA